MSEKRVDTVRLQEIVQGYSQSAALMAGVELGLFTAISGGAGTIAEIAAAIDLSETNAERLVTACHAIGLLSRRQGRFRNADDVERFLVEGGPSYAGPWMLFTKPRWNEWGRLAEHLRSGEQRVLGNYESFTVEDARRYHQATYSIGMGAGRRFVRQVDLSGRRKLLDLGGGSGAYSINAALAHSSIEAVVFDLPPVTVVAAEFIARHGVADRVATQAGDFTKDPFPTDADVVVMASNLPQYSRDIIAQVISKAFAALLPGGEMHLVGEMLDDDRAGPIGPAIWGLGEALAGSTGLAHAQADCLGYFARAGFRDVAAHVFVERTLTRVTGTKPAL